jgi:hypothetical protein
MLRKDKVLDIIINNTKGSEDADLKREVEEKPIAEKPNAEKPNAEEPNAEKPNAEEPEKDIKCVYFSNKLKYILI